jgi:hypothetical protein
LSHVIGFPDRGKDKETTGKDKETINDLQITTQKAKEETTRTPLKPGGELGAKEGLVFPLATNTKLIFDDVNKILLSVLVSNAQHQDFF